MRNIDELFAALAKSRFRRRFQLSAKEQHYLLQKGLPVIVDHARDFIRQRLAPAQPHNDGQQTPWRGHPVFIAQHATATCCRGCLQKWHEIAQGQVLNQQQQDYVLAVIAEWLQRQKSLVPPVAKQTDLFD